MLGFCIIHMIGVDYYSKAYLYTYINNYIWMQFFLCIHSILIIGIVCVLLDSTKTNLFYREFLEYVANADDSWFLMKGAPLGPLEATSGSLISILQKI